MKLTYGDKLLLAADEQRHGLAVIEKWKNEFCIGLVRLRAGSLGTQ